MRLSELLRALPPELAPSELLGGDAVIRGICHDSRRVAPGDLEVLPHHLRAHLLHRDLRHPAELLLRLRGVAEQRLHFGRAEVARVDPHDHVAHLQRRRPQFGSLALDVLDDADLLHAAAFEAQSDAELMNPESGAIVARGAGGDNGEIVLEDVPAGAYRLTVMMPDRPVIVRDVVIDGDSTIDIDAR